MEIKKVQLENIVNRMHQGINTAADKVKFASSGYPILQTRNITKGFISFNSVKYMNEEYWNKYKNKYKPEINQILLTNIGTIGKSVIVKKDADYLIHWNIFLIEPKKELVFSIYLKFFFDMLYMTKYYDLFLKGGTVKFISKSFLNHLEIPLPPLDKQKQIAKTLDKAQELIILRKESISKLDDLSKSIFIDMFGDPVSNPNQLKMVKLGELTDIKTGKTPSRKEPLYWDNGTENWATTTEVNKKLIFDTSEKITSFAVEKNNLTVYPIFTILMAMYGQGKTRGNVALLMEESTINQAFCAILPNENYNTYFILSFLKNSYENLRSLGRGGNQENLNLDIVKNFEVFLPSLEEQNKFAKIIEKVEQQKELYSQELKKLQYNFDALLQKSFQG